jgi:ribosomal protein S27AE
MIWVFKKCPRCSGDLFLNEDFRIHQSYWTCLQCGYDSVQEKKLEQLFKNNKNKELILI